MGNALSEATIRSVDWSRFRVAAGKATNFGQALSRLIVSSDAAETRSVWNGIENVVFAQDDIFSAAEATIDVVFAALVDGPSRHAKVALIDLLFLLLHGESPEDPSLRDRCHQRARRGLWLLTREAAAETETLRNSLLDVIELIDADQAEIARAWLAP
jgi:hypothetical protein